MGWEDKEDDRRQDEKGWDVNQDNAWGDEWDGKTTRTTGGWMKGIGGQPGQCLGR